MQNPNAPRRLRNTDGFYSPPASPFGPARPPLRRSSPFAMHRPAAHPAATARLRANQRHAVQPAATAARSAGHSSARPPETAPAAQAAHPAAMASKRTGGAAVLPSATFSYAPRYAGSARPAKQPPRGLRRLVHLGWKKSLLSAGAFVLVLCLAVGGWLGWQAYRNVARITHNNNPFSLLSVFHPVPLKSQNGRVNILIGGDSADRANAAANGGDLTDSIMVLSIDTHNDTAFMLSIPRDTWVQMPASGGPVAGTHQKINAANTFTNFSMGGYPHGGMGALEYVIQQNFGVPINYYALVNYGAFRDLVNALGGITVNIQSPDPRGLYDPQPFDGARVLKIPNGVQTIDGTAALNLARARGDARGSYGFPNSDFDRTLHQRWMVLAIKDKASQASVIANPFKVSGILNAVGKNITTDLKLNEIETLYSLTKKLNDVNITSENINTLNGPNTALLANYTAPNGESALIPAAGLDAFGAIQKDIAKLLSTDAVVKESANVVVLNGGNIVGLARAEGAVLTAKGMNVTAMASAPSTQATSAIIDNSAGKDPATKAALQSLFGANIVTNASLTSAYPNAAFIVVLGQNQQMPASASSSSPSASSTN